jgi:hypothetical protein
MKDFLKQNLKNGNEITFDNESTFTDTLHIMECRFIDDKRNSWRNGFKISFNGALFSFKTFNAFFKKFEQLKNDFDLQLKSW